MTIHAVTEAELPRWLRVLCAIFACCALAAFVLLARSLWIDEWTPASALKLAFPALGIALTLWCAVTGRPPLLHIRGRAET